MKVTSATRINFRIQHIIYVILLLSCIFSAGWLSNEYNIRSDWTAGARHSLSQDTLQLLAEINQPVSIRSYQADDATLIKAITEILNRYKYNNSNFNFQVINPDLHIAQAKADHIEKYGQTIIEYNGQQERIDSLSEESITNALLRLYRGEQASLLFLTQHNDISITDSSPRGYALLAQQLSQKGFISRHINLLQHTLSPGRDVLVISSADNALHENEIRSIVNYIQQGGNLLWLHESNTDQSMNAVAAELNISFLSGMIVDDNEKVRNMLQLKHPAIVPILEYRLHPITQKMQYYTLFTGASGLQTLSNDSPWIQSDLLITSDSSWSETGELFPSAQFDPQSDIPGPHVIGIAQQRQINNNNLASSQRVVIIGDSDFLNNQNLGKGGNLDFISKSFNWLSEADKLINISPKDAPDLELKLSTQAAAIISAVFLFALPLVFITSGLLIWHKRRKR